MGKTKRKRKNIHTNKQTTNQHTRKESNRSYSKEELIEIQTEAYYRAIRRIEDEKKDKEQEQKEQNTKPRLILAIALLLNVVLFPFKISKKIPLKNNFADSVLAIVISGIFEIIGFILWLFPIAFFVMYLAGSIEINRTFINVIIIFGFCLLLTLFGGIFIQAGNEIMDERNENRLYAYTASFMAVMSVIITIIALCFK